MAGDDGMAGARPRILFVDDEPLVLRGYRNQLRRRVDEWELVFLESPDEAVALLRGEGPAFDVVVSDMRMPRTDGATLLGEAKRLHPSTARIVLSGQIDADAALRVLPFAHQILAKPCLGRSLEEAIERSLRVRRLVAEPALRASIAGRGALPSPPSSYLQMLELLESPKSSIRDIAAVVERDPAMAAKAIQLVNSAYFGLPRHVGSIQDAVSVIGLHTLRSMVLCAGVFELTNHVPAARVEEVRLHGFLVAQLARSMFHRPDEAADAFLAGLLHDVGLLLLHEVEQPSVDHGTACAVLLGLWGLPHAVVDAVMRHHAPDLLDGEGLSIAAAVHLADRLAGRPIEGDPARRAVSDEELQRAGLAARAEELRAAGVPG